MTVFNRYLIEQIKSNGTSDGIINLREENIGNKEVEVLGAALLYNNTVFSVQLPSQYGTITYDGLMSFAKKIILREEPLAVETNNGQWNYAFRYIEDRKRLGQEVDDGKFAKLLPANVQNDNSTGDLTDSSKPTESLALEKDNAIQTTPVEENIVQAVLVEDNAIQTTPVEENAIQATPVEENVVQAASVVEESVDKVEEAVEDLVELESTASVESLSVDDSNVIVLENLNTSTPRNFTTIPSNNIQSEKIKSTGFFGKIFNGVTTTIKDTFTSLFNHNTTKVSNSTEDTVNKFYVIKDCMSQEDTGVLGHANIDIDSN